MRLVRNKIIKLCSFLMGMLSLLAQLAVASDTLLYKNAITHEKRLPNDASYDDTRMPLKTLEFSQINAGDTVLELGAGGGYSTELLSWVTGTNGKVYAHFLYNKARLENNRLSNVVALPPHPLIDMRAQLKKQGLERGSVDAIVVFYVLHDIYLNNEIYSAFYSDLLALLKPEGSLIIIDNAAKAGSELQHIGDLHRIDEHFVEKEVLSAGFLLDAKSSDFRNPNDDHSKPWGEFKGRQDRFAFRFKKPLK